MKIYELKQKKDTTLTVTGTNGNLVITIDGVDYTEAFATSATVTAGNFVTNEAAGILAAADVVVTNPSGADLLFVSNTSGRVFTISSENSTGDMATSEAVSKSGLAVQLFTDNIQNGGNITIQEIKDFGDFGGNSNVAGLSFKDDVSQLGVFEVLKRNVQHESELITYATDNDCTLDRKEIDGSSSSNLRAEA